MARNTQNAPVVRRPELDTLKAHIDRIFNALADGHGELLQRQQILEAAYLSLARDVEYALGPDQYADDQALYEQDVRVDPDNPANEVDLADHTEWEHHESPETDESPEEEAARLIAEAQAAAEHANEGV